MAIRHSAALAMLIALTAAAPASAGTVSMPFFGHNDNSRVGRGPSDSYGFSYVAGAGETNRLVVTQSEGAIVRVEDAAAPLSPGANCRSDGPNAVICSPAPPAPGVTAEVFQAVLDLGDAGDRLTLDGLGAQVTPGAGDDEVVSNARVTVDGGPGADLMRGALGSRLSYAGRTGDVLVSQDGLANDGELGEGDNVGPGFTSLTGGDGDDELHLDGPVPFGGSAEGGAGDDRLFGASSGERLEGGDGADQLHGAAGSDSLAGGRGDDQLQGAEGNDSLDGGPGADLMRGGADRDGLTFYPLGATPNPIDVTLDDRPGDGPVGENDDVGSDVENVLGTFFDDRIVGSDADNQLEGAGGNNIIEGRGGADRLSGSGRLVGGPGVDTFFLDYPFPRFGDELQTVDALDGEREEVYCRRGSPELMVDPFDALHDCAPDVVGPTSARIRATRAGTVRMRVRCEPGSRIRCAGKAYALRDTERGAVVGRARFALPANGRSAVVEVRLTRGYVVELRRARRLPVIFRFVTYRTAPSPSKRETFVPSQRPSSTPPMTLLAPRPR